MRGELLAENFETTVHVQLLDGLPVAVYAGR